MSEQYILILLEYNGHYFLNRGLIESITENEVLTSTANAPTKQNSQNEWEIYDSDFHAILTISDKQRGSANFMKLIQSATWFSGGVLRSIWSL